MAASDADSDADTAPEVKHRATPVKLPSYLRKGITYQQLPAWHDAAALHAFRREHGKSMYNAVETDERAPLAHFKRLENGSVRAWAAYENKAMVGLVSAEDRSDYRTRGSSGRPWAVCHLVVKATHRRKGVGGALARLAAALLLAGDQRCAELYVTTHADDSAAVATFLRAGFDELVTLADFRQGRDATVLRKRRGGGVPVAPPQPVPPPPKPPAEVIPRWQRDYAKGPLTESSYPGGEAA
jgi:GNAT superfamily N-acetyltransferase